MSESNATATLRTHLKAEGAHVQRFEDKLTPGIPDTMATINGFPVFLEGKFVKDLPAKDDTLVRFGSKGEDRLVHQRNWLTAHRKAGGLSFWWVRVRDGGWYLFEDKFNWLTDGVPKKILLEQENLGSAKAMVARLNAVVDKYLKTAWLQPHNRVIRHARLCYNSVIGSTEDDDAEVAQDGWRRGVPR